MSGPLPTKLTICSTCLDTSCAGEAGIGGGGKMFAMLEEKHREHPDKDAVELVALRCLMACTEGCVVTVAAEGKMQYLLGRLPAEDGVAEQLLDFAVLHARSETGVTENHNWPPKIRSNFLGRIPPPASMDVDWNDEGCNL
ncbi:DUF1636 domain-containing protein [Pelagibius sp. Alg239-R121]|uniref:DUF1636 domain-containing protein n=1 Tax=Pelagibius sp. Alg239-R121 TaxID=2993448 RepID=UPI0024A6B8C1|nr:DUF1636 domain-containing protein [Pelagibius sp. Alg239-R121]